MDEPTADSHEICITQNTATDMEASQSICMVPNPACETIVETSQCMVPHAVTETIVESAPSMCIVPKPDPDMDISEQTLGMITETITNHTLEATQNICMVPTTISNHVLESSQNICIVPTTVASQEMEAAQNICIVPKSVQSQVLENGQNVCIVPKSAVTNSSTVASPILESAQVGIVPKSTPASQVEVIKTLQEPSMENMSNHQYVERKTNERPAHFRKPPPEKFIHEGCMYNFISYSKNRRFKFWRCDKRSQGCKVRIHTDSRTNKVIFKIIMSYLSTLYC